MFECFDFDEVTTPEVAQRLFQCIASDPARLGPRAVDRSLALYGAGELGRMAREYLERLGVPVQYVVDRRSADLRHDPYWAGVSLLEPDDVPIPRRNDVLLAVCVVTGSYAGLAQELASAGWSDVVPFYDIAEGFRSRHPLSNGWFAAPLTQADAERIVGVLDAWGDDTSRAHHLQFMAWRRLRQEWRFAHAPVTIADRFFIPEVMAKLTEDEAFADVGAHVGKVMQRFIEIVRGKFRRVWAVEPDPVSLDALSVMVSTQPTEIQRHINIVPAVLADVAGERKFYYGLGYASQCSDLGEPVACRTLDELGLAPSFIKLHLEGMELDALRGAVTTLARCRPVIAATSYHNEAGLWALPRWLMDNLDGYRVLMRMHGWCGTGAVVYAIPQEKTGAA
jgi:FkbM family methyltransferase